MTWPDLTLVDLSDCGHWERSRGMETIAVGAVLTSYGYARESTALRTGIKQFVESRITLSVVYDIVTAVPVSVISHRMGSAV